MSYQSLAQYVLQLFANLPMDMSPYAFQLGEYVMIHQKKNLLNGISDSLLAKKKRNIKNIRKKLRLEILKSRQTLSAVRWLPTENDKSEVNEFADVDTRDYLELSTCDAHTLQSSADYFLYKGWAFPDSTMVSNPDSIPPTVDGSVPNRTPNSKPVSELLDVASHDELELNALGMQSFAFEPEPGYVLDAASQDELELNALGMQSFTFEPEPGYVLDVASQDELELNALGMQSFTFEPEPGYVLDVASQDELELNALGMQSFTFEPEPGHVLDVASQDELELNALGMQSFTFEPDPENVL